ncbi:MAG TPA: cupin domain-containing protein [Candidatus Mediterraneibacter norfolkensis]|nr:cupin domain-containing protein [Candidatus Mediterraneibacter norfolkensis]
MKFVMSDEGERYTPDGHDEEVFSRIIYKDGIDIHMTTFPGGTGMEEEFHEKISHVFYMLKGQMEVLKHKKVLNRLYEGDAVYIPAGEAHEIKNCSETDAVFLAVNFEENRRPKYEKSS